MLDPNPSPVAAPATDRIAAAAEAIGTAFAGDEPAPQAEPEAAPEAAPEPAEAQPETVPEPAPEPAAEQDQKAGGLAWRAAQVRRKEKAVERQMGEVKAALDRIEQERQSLDQWRQLPDLARRDPVSAFDAIADRAGVSPSVLYERLTKRQLNQPEPAEAAIAEVAELKAELAALRGSLTKRDQERQQQYTQDQERAHFEADLDGIIAEARNADARPEVQAWDDHELAAAARVVLQNIYRDKRFDMTYAEAADQLHSWAKEQAGRWQSWVEKRKSNTSEARDGQGTPAEQSAKPAGLKPRSTVTNRDSAQSVDTRNMSHAERLKKASALIAESLK